MAFDIKSFPILAPFACAVDFLPDQHPNGALSRRAKCVAAFVNLVPRRKKSVDILTKSVGIFVKSVDILTKSAGISIKDMGLPVKSEGILTKSTAILAKNTGVLKKNKGTPTLSAIILLILSKILEAEKDLRKIRDDRSIPRGDALIFYLRNTPTERCHAVTASFIP